MSEFTPAQTEEIIDIVNDAIEERSDAIEDVIEVTEFVEGDEVPIVRESGNGKSYGRAPVNLFGGSGGGYTPPVGGIPRRDLASDVQASLGKADNAVNKSTTINGKALTSNITLNASDVNALPANTTVPSKTSDLTNDSGFVTSSDIANKADANNVYTKSETYTKAEVNGLVSTPNQNYVSVTATPQTTSVASLLPATGSVDTIYRVGSWDGTQYAANVYTEYAWSSTGATYVPLNTKTGAVDTSLVKNSTNPISGGCMYDVQHGNENSFAMVSDITELEPVKVEEGKFFYNDGERTNSGFRYYKYAVTGGEKYLFSSYFGAYTNIYFIYWIDGNGNIAYNPDYAGRGESNPNPISYNNELITAPSGAVYACINESKHNTDKTSLKHVGSIIESIQLEEQIKKIAEAVCESGFVERTYKEQLGVFPYYQSGEMRMIATMTSYIFDGINPTKTYKAKDFGIPDSTYTNIAHVLYYNGNTFLGYDPNTYNDQGPYYQSDFMQLTVPPTCTKIIICSQRDYTDKPVLMEEGLVPVSLQGLYDIIGTRAYLPSCSLGSVRTEGKWLLVDSNTYTDKPVTSNIGWLKVTVIPGFNVLILQEFLSWDGKYFKRQFMDSSVAGEWQPISGGGNTYNVYNTFNNTEQTVNLMATPSITADTNNYLAPTGTTADRTADILAMLQSSGVCRLGKGDYWVDSLIMPANSAIIGSGSSTKIKLKSGDNKFAIKMGTHCTVKDLWLDGASSAITPSATVGTRHAILWQGNYTSTQDSSRQPYASTVMNVWIYNFAGGGITCTDTGYGTWNYLSATNVQIATCDAGINVSYWSEYHKFTNVRTYSCYYGCINNGGNNMFVNCDFSSCSGVAFLMDNAQGQSPNNSHGSCIGCVFNHTASNTGVGIKMLNCANGFIFEGCQIFFSKIQIEDSLGVVVSACNFGYSNCDISVDGGGVVMFIGSTFQGAPTITVTDNNKVHFVNCYNRSTGEVISN